MVQDTYLSPRASREPKHFPSFSVPKIIGSFNLDENRTYSPGTKNCKYLRKAGLEYPVHLDLNKGYENVIHKSAQCENEKLDHILRFITENMDKLEDHDEHVEGKRRTDHKKKINVDFVCFRGLLRLLMCTPYENRDPWIILATKFKGTIYLCAHETEQKQTERLNTSDTSQRILSYGFKFEQYMLTDDPSTAPNTESPVNESEEFCCMFKTNLEGKRVLYGAEMDGIDSEVKYDLDHVDLNKVQFVELKVNLRAVHEKQKANYFRYKLRNWWAQCFLAKIDKIVVGTRTQNGIVNELSELEVRNIPRLVRDKNAWSPAVCMTFCNQFLQMVASHMEGMNDPYTVLKFEYNPSRENTIKFQIYENKSPLSFIPEWYIKQFK